MDHHLFRCVDLSLAVCLQESFGGFGIGPSHFCRSMSVLLRMTSAAFQKSPSQASDASIDKIHAEALALEK